MNCICQSILWFVITLSFSLEILCPLEFCAQGGHPWPSNDTPLFGAVTYFAAWIVCITLVWAVVWIFILWNREFSLAVTCQDLLCVDMLAVLHNVFDMMCICLSVSVMDKKENYWFIVGIQYSTARPWVWGKSPGVKVYLGAGSFRTLRYRYMDWTIGAGEFELCKLGPAKTGRKTGYR